MESREVFVVDAFAREPYGGIPVAVLPDGDGCSSAQCRVLASEVGAVGTVALCDGALQYTAAEERRERGIVAGGVAGGVALDEHGLLQDGGCSITAEDTDTRVRHTDGATLVERPVPPVESADRSLAVVADALGIDEATLADVGADLPLARSGEALLVPVNFLEHLNRVTARPESLSSLLADTDCSMVVAFTFDTLDRDKDVHARVLDPTAPGGEVTTASNPLLGLGRHLTAVGVFDGERDRIDIECGYRLDRPSTVCVSITDPVGVGGTATTVLEGTMTLPSDDGDDIIEV